mgnify:CR=1 FL=1
MLVPVLAIGALGVVAVMGVVAAFIITAWLGQPVPVLGFEQTFDQPIDFPHTVHASLKQLDHVPAESLPEGTCDGRPDGRKELLTRLCEESISSLDELNIRYIFAWNRLVADAKRGVQPYVGFGGHWTVDGNRGAAQDIAHVIMGTVKYR